MRYHDFSAVSRFSPVHEVQSLCKWCTTLNRGPAQPGSSFVVGFFFSSQTRQCHQFHWCHSILADTWHHYYTRFAEAIMKWHYQRFKCSLSIPTLSFRFKTMERINHIIFLQTYLSQIFCCTKLLLHLAFSYHEKIPPYDTSSVSAQSYRWSIYHLLTHYANTLGY